MHCDPGIGEMGESWTPLMMGLLMRVASNPSPSHFNLWGPSLLLGPEPHSAFQIAFNMFDTDGNQRVDKHEFLVVRNVAAATIRQDGSYLNVLIIRFFYFSFSLCSDLFFRFLVLCSLWLVSGWIRPRVGCPLSPHGAIRTTTTYAMSF